MTTEPIDIPHALPEPEIRAPSAAKTRPGLGVPVGPSPTDLETRINARRKELRDQLVERTLDTHLDAAEARDALKAKISELAHLIKHGVVDGWANISEPTKQKLDRWLADTLPASERWQS